MTGFIQYLFVIGQSGQELIRPASTSDRVRGRQDLAMLCHLLSTKQL
jgi:hypothetical protein